ncbi:hypothetical protein CTEN210_09707 [Chaetoceros tenuissimus]|uniref:Uncharacterized protein n=1 Tax=Chaetoceros tenuissimus TaxID=426638 RepID=A0AAD3CVZ5_9STRA|nr:hypothetical protein CTEN210_09707 [Chaetoceros tenuissimus]
MAKSTKSNLAAWQKCKKLKWSSPSRALPHGLSGIVSVSLGMYLIANSMIGNLSPYKRFMDVNVPIVLMLYSFLSAFNAVAGAQLSHLAWKETQMIFRRCAFLQLCLAFYTLRFAPVFDQALSTIQSIENSVISEVFMSWIHYFDVMFAIILVFCTLSFQQVAFEQWIVHKKRAIASAVSIGSLGILLLSTYPIQLAIGGHSWWNCIQQTYSEQNVGMVGYIYVPATVTFSLILFSATLYQRGIISDVQFGIGAVVITIVCLVGTVLSQELHIPFVSTQRIYLPCQEPIEDSTEAYILNTLDFSLYARSFWREVFGVHIEQN